MASRAEKSPHGSIFGGGLDFHRLAVDNGGGGTQRLSCRRSDSLRFGYAAEIFAARSSHGRFIPALGPRVRRRLNSSHLGRFVRAAVDENSPILISRTVSASQRASRAAYSLRCRCLKL